MRLKRYAAAILIAAVPASLVILYCGLAKPSAAQGLTARATITLELRRIEARDETALFGNSSYMSSRLSFIDAYSVKSDYPQFGGWSGLAYDRQRQRFVAVSDTGHWLTFDGIKENAAPPAGIPVLTWMTADIGPVLDMSGKSAAATGSGPRDIEAIALSGDGIYLGFESPSSGFYYSDAQDIETAEFHRLYKISREFSDLPKGYGIEALTRISNPPEPLTLLAIAERPSKRHPDFVESWLIQPASKAPSRESATATASASTSAPSSPASKSDPSAPPVTTAPATLAAIAHPRLGNLDGYDVSEIAWSPACGLFGIERTLTWYGRLKVRLLKLNIAADRRSIDSDVLFVGDSGGDAVDNFEGLAIVDDGPGVCDLYAISDDNFLPIQKTILLHLRYKEDA